MRILCFLLIGLICNLCYGQERYLDEAFKKVEVSTYTYLQKGEESLKVDVYSPSGDKEVQRPLLLYVHGGGFKGGSRDEDIFIKFCEAMARKGYVAASMDYSLLKKDQSFGCDQPAPAKVETFLRTARDVSYATAFLLDQAKELRIDPSKVILLGSSAGAEAILHTAYWDKTREDTNGRILPESFQYAGIVSMAGAITFIGWINADSAIPTQLLHGTCDNLVPYGYAPHHYCAPEDPGYLMLHGGKSIAERLADLGKPYYLVTGCFDNHDWHGKPLNAYRDQVTDFLYHDVLLGEYRQLHQVFETDGGSPCPEYNAYNFCEQ